MNFILDVIIDFSGITYDYLDCYRLAHTKESMWTEQFELELLSISDFYDIGSTTDNEQHGIIFISADEMEFRQEIEAFVTIIKELSEDSDYCSISLLYKSERLSLPSLAARNFILQTMTSSFYKVHILVAERCYKNKFGSTDDNAFNNLIETPDGVRVSGCTFGNDNPLQKDVTDIVDMQVTDDPNTHDDSNKVAKLILNINVFPPEMDRKLVTKVWRVNQLADLNRNELLNQIKVLVTSHVKPQELYIKNGKMHWVRETLIFLLQAFLHFAGLIFTKILRVISGNTRQQTGSGHDESDDDV